MSRSVTLVTGRARAIALIAIATFFASLLMTAASVAAPGSVLAAKPSTSPGNGGGGNGGGGQQETIPGWCNSIRSPNDASGVEFSFQQNVGGALYERTNGTATLTGTVAGFYDAATDGGLVTENTLTFTAKFSGGEGPWCISYGGKAVASGTFDEASSTYDAATGYYYFTRSFNLRDVIAAVPGAKQGKGRGTTSEVCVGARLTGGTPTPGAPKGHYCFSLGLNSKVRQAPTPTCGDPGQAACPSDPGGGVLSVVTEKPATAPPTDGLASTSSSTIPALGVLLLILAAILGTIGWFTPATKRIRR